MPLDDTLRMPVLQLDSLLGRARDDDEPVFPLVRRRALLPERMTVPMDRGASTTVSIVLLVALVLGALLLWVLR